MFCIHCLGDVVRKDSHNDYSTVIFSSFHQVSITAQQSSEEEIGNGIIAVDLIELMLDEQCSYLPLEAEIGTPPPTTTTPLPTPTPGFDFSCTFDDSENFLCGWTDVSQPGSSWNIVKVCLLTFGNWSIVSHPLQEMKYIDQSKLFHLLQ